MSSEPEELFSSEKLEGTTLHGSAFCPFGKSPRQKSQAPRHKLEESLIWDWFFWYRRLLSMAAREREWGRGAVSPAHQSWTLNSVILTSSPTPIITICPLKCPWLWLAPCARCLPLLLPIHSPLFPILLCALRGWPARVYQWVPCPLTSSWVWDWQEINRKKQRALGELGCLFSKFPPFGIPKLCLHQEFSVNSPISPIPVTHPLICHSRGNGGPLLLIWGSLLCLVVSLHPSHTFVNSFFMKFCLSYPNLRVPSVSC